MKILDKNLKIKIINEIKMIPLWVEMRNEMRENIFYNISGDNSGIRGNSTSDKTAQTVIKILENKDLNTLEYRIKMFNVVIKNYSDKQIYKKLFEEEKTIYDTSQEMQISKPYVIKLKEEFIYKMGVAWGHIRVV